MAVVGTCTSAKAWCSGSVGLDHTLVDTHTADGPRLFVVEPQLLEPVAGSWEPIGMAASASHTMRFDVRIAPRRRRWRTRHVDVDRPGFWHGGAGIAACWYGGALGVIDALCVHVARPR